MALEKETLSFWERLIKLVNKYGYWKLTKVVLFVSFTVFFIYAAKNVGQNFTLERQKEIIGEVMKEKEEQKFIDHAQQMTLRENIKPLVSNLLKTAILEMDADRAFVIELHNGTNNTAGLPFIHCTMTYEEDAKGIESIDEDYQNLSLSRFNFPLYLHNHDLWYGSVDDFKDVDPKAAGRMKYNGVTFVVLTTIRSDNSEIGYFGFTYCNGKKPKDEKIIMEYMLNSVQKLSKWLNNNDNDS